MLCASILDIPVCTIRFSFLVIVEQRYGWPGIGMNSMLIVLRSIEQRDCIFTYTSTYPTSPLAITRPLRIRSLASYSCTHAPESKPTGPMTGRTKPRRRAHAGFVDVGSWWWRRRRQCHGGSLVSQYFFGWGYGRTLFRLLFHHGCFKTLRMSYIDSAAVYPADVRLSSPLPPTLSLPPPPTIFPTAHRPPGCPRASISNKHLQSILARAADSSFR